MGFRISAVIAAIDGKVTADPVPPTATAAHAKDSAPLGVPSSTRAVVPAPANTSKRELHHIQLNMDNLLGVRSQVRLGGRAVQSWA